MATSISSRISAFFDSQINAILLAQAEAVAKDARANAPTQRIRANVNITPVMDTPDGKRITIYVPIKDAPEAAAYEFGSGLHDPESPHTIDINNRNAPNLHFYWTKQERWFVGPHVNHPGVAAKPYLAPAIEKNRATFRGRLTNALMAVTRAAIQAGFVK